MKPTTKRFIGGLVIGTFFGSIIGITAYATYIVMLFNIK